MSCEGLLTNLSLSSATTQDRNSSLLADCVTSSEVSDKGLLRQLVWFTEVVLMKQFTGLGASVATLSWILLPS